MSSTSSSTSSTSAPVSNAPASAFPLSHNSNTFNEFVLKKVDEVVEATTPPSKIVDYAKHLMTEL